MPDETVPWDQKCPLCRIDLEHVSPHRFKHRRGMAPAGGVSCLLEGVAHDSTTWKAHALARRDAALLEVAAIVEGSTGHVADDHVKVQRPDLVLLSFFNWKREIAARIREIVAGEKESGG